MEKIAVGPGFPKKLLDLDNPLEDTLEKLAFYKKKKIENLSVCFLNRPRHKNIFDIVKKKKCKKFLIPDGDIFGAISTSIKKFNIDLYIGIGGAPEGVLAASALKCLNGQMQCRLIFSNSQQRKRAMKMGIKNLKRKYQIEDLIKKDSIFVATGVTDGYLLSGVKKKKNIFETHSLIISTKTKKIDFKKSKFKI